MSTVTVWKFDTPHGADDALDKLESMHRDLLLELHDAAVVSWMPQHRHPDTRQLRSSSGPGAVGGAFWGTLIGLMFFVPVLGAAIGAASGALLGQLKQVGLSDAFMGDVRTKVQPGTSALFAMTSQQVLEQMAEELSETNAELIKTNLSDENEARLREAFGDEA